LRRAALGVIRVVLANGLRLNLDTWIDMGLLRHKIALHRAAAQEGEIDTLEEVLDEIADRGVFGAALRAVLDARRRDGRELPEEAPVLRTVGDAVPDLSTDLLAFLHDRLKVHLRSEGVRHDVIDAVLAMPGSDDLTLVVARARALDATLATEEGGNLVQGFKRANNILTQAEEADGVEYSFGPDPKYAEDETEKALFAALDAADAEIRPAMQAEDFARAMAAMAALRGPIDAFFEAVQVNAPNPVLRRNRLNLLARIRDTCLQVADLRRIEG
jgi:glycyl-tRNA synthetase beta chain